VPNVVEIRDGWKLYIVAGGMMVRILISTVQNENLRSLDLTTLCTYVGLMVSTISVNTGYLTSINNLLFIMVTHLVLHEVGTRFLYIV
jgi:hypothetical protein